MTPSTSFTFQRLDIDQEAIPDSATLVYGVTCRIVEMDIINPTNSPITVTIQNNNSDPAWVVMQVAAATAAGNSMLNYRSAVGKKMTGGLKWSASATGLLGSLCIRTNTP